MVQVGLRARRLGLAADALGVLAETDLQAILGLAAARQAGALDRRFHPDAAVGQRAGRRRCGHAAAGMHRGAGALCQDRRRLRGHRRPRDQGGRDCRPEAPRASGRHRVVFRERGGQPLPYRAGHQEPLRGGERARLLRHDRHGTEGGAQPGGDLPGAPGTAGGGQHRHGHARGRSAAADRAAGAGGSHALRRAAPHRAGARCQPPGDAARRGRTATRSSRCRSTTCSSTSSAASRSTETGMGLAGRAGARLEPARPAAARARSWRSASSA